ncbi:MAG: hypothetical protein EBU33_05550, partial [Sphingobacteriia bacterium]|nr:hypothetical protein [Sphingobacteriia bacterium]
TNAAEGHRPKNRQIHLGWARIVLNNLGRAIRVTKEAARNDLGNFLHKCRQEVRLAINTPLIALAGSIVNHVVASIGTEGKVRHVGKERKGKKVQRKDVLCVRGIYNT